MRVSSHSGGSCSCSGEIGASDVPYPRGRGPNVPLCTTLQYAQAPGAVAEAIKEAEEACKDGSTSQCAAAWDVVSVWMVWCMWR